MPKDYHSVCKDCGYPVPPGDELCLRCEIRPTRQKIMRKRGRGRESR